MSYHKDTTLPLTPETFFHIFNRGNKGIKIFYQEKNYPYFLKKYATALSNYVDTYTYCLIPNHFHFIIRVKSQSDILNTAIKDYKIVPKSMWNSIKNYAEEFHPRYFENHPKFLRYIVLKNLDNEMETKNLIAILPENIKDHLACWLVSDTFRKFFGAYARAINKQENENGSLFQKNFRRKIIDSDVYFTQLVWYLHNNGVHHGLCKNFKDYQWSSYHRILIESKTLLKKSEVLDWFGGRQAFINFHDNVQIDWNLLNNVIIEDD